MCVFIVNPQYLLQICLMGLINKRLRNFSVFQFPLDALANHHVQAQPRRKQYASPLIPEQYSWEFKFIEEETKLKPWLKHAKSFVLIHHHHWIYCISIFKGIFNKSFTVVYPATNLIRSCQCCLFKSAWQQTDVFTFFHQLFQIFMVNCLHSPKLQNSSRNGKIKDESASKANDMRKGSFLSRIHEQQQTQPQNTMRMNTKDASILLSDNFFIDDLKVVEIFDGLQKFIDDVDIALTSSERQLDNNQCQQANEEMKIKSEDCINQYEYWCMKSKLCDSEQQYGNNLLMSTKKTFLF